MADIASLSLEVKSDQVKQAVAALNELPRAASAAERAAQKWGAAHDVAGRSADDFSKRVQRTIADLKFQSDQLARTATEQERFTALRRAGVSASSAEGQAITASVAALQAQKAALGENLTVTQKVTAAWESVKAALAAVAAIEIVRKVIEWARSTLEVTGALGNLATQLGITTNGLQALQFGAVQSGVKMEQLETAISKFSQTMGDAAQGTKAPIEALQQLGVKNLDVQGHLRPTEDLLVDVARAILKIEDPAKRSAAAVDFFGKAGSRMLPLLPQIAAGMDTMSASAAHAGAMISDETVKKLDEFNNKLEASKLRTRSWAAQLLADTIDASKAFAEFDDKVTAATGSWIGKSLDQVKGWAADLKDLAGQAVAGFLGAFAAMPEQLGKLFVDAFNAALAGVAKGINGITAWVSEHAPAWMGLGGGGTEVPVITLGGGGFSLDAIKAAAAKAATDRAAQQQAANDQAALQSSLAAQGGIQGRGAPTGKFTSPPPSAPGASTTAIKDTSNAAENAAKAFAKYSAQLDATVNAQDLMTAAAAKGDLVFDEAKAKVEATNKVLEIFGNTAGANAQKVDELAAKLLKISQGKSAEAFAVATTELQKQNVLLEAQIRLMDQAPEIQAREIALIKAKQEAEKAGTAVTQEMIDARTKAIEQNETLKIQQDQLKKAQELWTAPLKRALEDIQTTAADAFEQILTSGNFSFQSLGETFKKIIIKMAAEFLALATIRPVMSVLVNAISPSMAGQLGLSGSGSGLGGMFGGSGGGGISDFLGQTLFGGSENLGPLQPGAASLGSSGGLTIGGALGGAASIGMGAYSLLSGKGGIGSMLGGGLGIAGGLTSMLGPMLGLASSLAGPIGMGIGLLGSLLPSLLGGGSKPAPPANRAYGEINMQSGAWQTSGGSWGGDQGALTSALTGMTSSMDSIFGMLGGVKDASRTWGVGLSSLSQMSGEGTAEGWNVNEQTSTLVGPGGRRMPWGQGSTPGDIGMEAAGVQAALNSILGGAVGDISDNMRKALEGVNASGKDTFDILGKVVTEIKTFDDAIASFGKTVTDAGTALTNIDTTFQSLIDIGNKYGLDNSAIQAEKQKQRALVGSDFTDSIARMLDPSDVNVAIADATKERKTLVENNQALLTAGIADYYDQIVSIEQIYANKRLKIANDANAQALAAQLQINTALVSAVTSSVSTIEDLIKQLTPGGDLANVDPSSQLAGLRASYNASFAQAIADPSNAALIQKAVADAQAFAETSLRFNAGGSAYVSDQQMILAQSQALQAATTQQGIGQASDPAIKNLLQQLLGAVSESTNDNSQRDADMATVISLLTRYLANGRTAA